MVLIKVIFFIFCFQLMINSVTLAVHSPTVARNPSILIEGCVDDGCLTTLMRNYNLISKCFQPLHETLSTDDDEYSKKLCCNIVTYERCLFPYIIFLCGLDSLDKFELELRSVNALCSLTTLQWNKCETNQTAPAPNEEELTE